MLYDGKPSPINRKPSTLKIPATRRNRRKGVLCSEDDSAISDTVPPFRSTFYDLQLPRYPSPQVSSQSESDSLLLSCPFSLQPLFYFVVIAFLSNLENHEIRIIIQSVSLSHRCVPSSPLKKPSLALLFHRSTLIVDLFFAPHVADCTGIIDPQGTPSDDCTSTYTMLGALTRVLQYSIAARNCAQSCIAGGKSTLLVSWGKV